MKKIEFLGWDANNYARATQFVKLKFPGKSKTSELKPEELAELFMLLDRELAAAPLDEEPPF